MKLTPKNWSDFQHYKDRSPAWIKLHKRLLDDYEFSQLPVESRALAPMLWLLASENEEGVIEGTLEKLGFRLHMSPHEVAEALQPLLERGFFSEGEDRAAPKERWPSRYVSVELKQQVLDRDGGKCVACDSASDLEIDHKTPVSKGGKSEIDNLQVLCRSCNRSKRVKTAEQFATQINPERSLEKRLGEEQEKKESCRAPRFDTSTFEEFWKEYPKRKGDNPKNPARKQFEAAVRQGSDPNAIISGVKAAKSRNSDKIGTEFIPQAVKWLRDRRWEDYADTPEVPSGPINPNEFAVRMFKQTGRWNSAYGPEPGKPGCRASSEDLAKYGYQSEAA